MSQIREIRDEKLDFWINHNLNVLFVGHYGTGKTTRILDAFNRAKLKFKYFSAATMDPWCDFVGVPKEREDEKGSYLDYLLPKDFRDDTVEAIYLDEYNRAHKKVRNAVMELLQFKSINGRKFNKLRIVWASINPEDEGDYQVEPLDKAQKDRFHIHVLTPYLPSYKFFEENYGSHQAKVVIDWWEGLSPELQMEVSPRRLQYALHIYKVGGDIKDVIPHQCNPSKLINLLNTGPADEKLREFFKTNDLDGAKKFLQVENNYSNCLKYIVETLPKDIPNSDWAGFFLPVLSPEKLSSLIAVNRFAYKFVLKNTNIDVFSRTIQDVLTTKTNKTLIRQIKKDIGEDKVLAAQFSNINTLLAEEPYFNRQGTHSINWANFIAVLLKQPLDTTPQRCKVYSELTSNLPPTLTLAEAVTTLEVLNLIATRSHTDTLAANFDHLVGVVNHCIAQIHRNLGISWTEILTNYGTKFDKLLTKIRDADLEKKLFCPSKAVLRFLETENGHHRTENGHHSR